MAVVKLAIRSRMERAKAISFFIGYVLLFLSRFSLCARNGRRLFYCIHYMPAHRRSLRFQDAHNPVDKHIIRRVNTGSDRRLPHAIRAKIRILQDCLLCILRDDLVGHTRHLLVFCHMSVTPPHQQPRCNRAPASSLSASHNPTFQAGVWHILAHRRQIPWKTFFASMIIRRPEGRRRVSGGLPPARPWGQPRSGGGEGFKSTGRQTVETCRQS